MWPTVMWVDVRSRLRSWGKWSRPPCSTWVLPNEENTAAKSLPELFPVATFTQTQMNCSFTSFGAILLIDKPAITLMIRKIINTEVSSLVQLTGMNKLALLCHAKDTIHTRLRPDWSSCLFSLCSPAWEVCQSGYWASERRAAVRAARHRKDPVRPCCG